MGRQLRVYRVEPASFPEDFPERLEAFREAAGLPDVNWQGNSTPTCASSSVGTTGPAPIRPTSWPCLSWPPGWACSTCCYRRWGALVWTRMLPVSKLCPHRTSFRPLASSELKGISSLIKVCELGYVHCRRPLCWLHDPTKHPSAGSHPRLSFHQFDGRMPSESTGHPSPVHL